MLGKLETLLGSTGDSLPPIETICAAYAKARNISEGKLNEYTKGFLEERLLHCSSKGGTLKIFIFGDLEYYNTFRGTRPTDAQGLSLKAGGLVKQQHLTKEQGCIFIKALYEAKYGEVLQDNILSQALPELKEAKSKKKPQEGMIQDNEKIDTSKTENVLSSRLMTGCIAAIFGAATCYISSKIRTKYISSSALGSYGFLLDASVGIAFAGLATWACRESLSVDQARNQKL
jgi:hypothetical protein